MKAKLIISVSLICVALLLVSLALGVTVARANTGAPAEKTDTPQEYAYLVSVYDGYMAVFLPDKTLFKVTEIRVSTLRLADQEMLRRGVTLQDEESLARFLEDFVP